MSLKEFKLPELGEGIKDGDVVKVLIKPGDTIRAEQSVLEIETNKAVAEVPAPEDGVVQSVAVQAGTKAKVGQVLFVYETGSTAITTSEGNRDAVLQTPASTPLSISQSQSQSHSPSSSPSPSSETVQHSSSSHLVAAAPSARREAREIGVDIGHVEGSGPGGRITVEDVRQHSRSSQIHEGTSSSHVLRSSSFTPLSDFSKFGATERKAMSNVRRITAERLSEAWQTIPHVTQFDKADVTVLEKLRAKFAKRAEEAGGKLTVTVILMKIVASALKVFPPFNASVDMQTHEIVYKKYFNIGIAVDTDRGLIVPVIRDVNKKNIIELSRELTQAGERARQHKTTLDEMQGASITITNLGGIGGAFFTPIINPPEVAILGVSRTTTEPVFSNGQWEPRQMLPLSLSYDHRLIDGADGARFLRWIAEAIKDPFLMELEG